MAPIAVVIGAPGAGKSTVGRRLAGHTVVWLQVGLSDAARRVGMNTARPLLLGNVRQTMGRLLEERLPLYASVATITVETTGRPVREVVAEVVAALEEGEDDA